jgi:uncharacterized protein YdaU (DUF1376 family)
MPVFTDALIGDTTHLSAEEFGAYFLLLMATWRNNGVPIKDDPARISRICRVTSRRWREGMRDTLAQFFDLSDGTWRQKRLEKEWERVKRLGDVSRANGPAGGRPRKHNPAAASPEATKDEGQNASMNRRPARRDGDGKSLEINGSHNPAGYNHNQRSEAPHQNQEILIKKIKGSDGRSAPLRERKKQLLLQKLMRYCHARMSSEDRAAALGGLTGLDGNRDAQWWFDFVDRKMRADKWDDTANGTAA